MAIIAKLRQAHRVGIIVDKGGHHLTRIGRVPLGRHTARHLGLRWDLKVNGRKLSRAVTG